jgi:hypothetical protein
MTTVGRKTAIKALVGVVGMLKLGARYLIPSDNPVERNRTLRMKLAVFMGRSKLMGKNWVK